MGKEHIYKIQLEHVKNVLQLGVLDFSGETCK